MRTENPLRSCLLFVVLASQLACPKAPAQSTRSKVDFIADRPIDPPATALEIGGLSSSEATTVTFGRFRSVQVNVGFNNSNTLGDAANGPSIAISSTNPKIIYIGLRQFDSVSSDFCEAGDGYSQNGGATWSSYVLDNGHFRSLPSLTADGFGCFYYASQRLDDPNSYDYRVDVFKACSSGWGGPIFAYGGNKPWIVADKRTSGLGAGFLYEFWNGFYSSSPSHDFTRSTNRAASFQPADTFPETNLIFGTMDVDSEGTLYLAGLWRGNEHHLDVAVRRSRNAKDGSATPRFDTPRFIDMGGRAFGITGGPNGDGLWGQVWVVAHPFKIDHVYVLATVFNYDEDAGDVMFSRSVDGGNTWSIPVQVYEEPQTPSSQWFGTMSIAPNGRLDVIWNDTRSSEDNLWSALYYSFFLDEGHTWSASEQLTPVFNTYLGFPHNNNKIGDYYHMVSDNGGGNLAYAATFNGEQDIYFLRIGQDCNQNGLDDDCDTACGPSGTRCRVAGCGLSADCNGNHVPDECEPNQDCNLNGQRDICEMGNSGELDCDANNVPDLCEDAHDCDGNGRPDFCDVYLHGDCNANGVSDTCDIAALASADRNLDGIPDECQGACCDCFGCEDVSPLECSARQGRFTGPSIFCGDAEACTSALSNDFRQAPDRLPSAPAIEREFDNRCASLFDSESVRCPSWQTIGADLWYTYRAPCDGLVLFSSCEVTDFDAMLSVYDAGTSCVPPEDGSSPLGCDDDSCHPTGPAYVYVNVVAGHCYSVRLGGWDGAMGLGKLKITYMSSCAPTDANGDAASDLADFASLQNCFASTSVSCEWADFDHDGQIDVNDYVVFEIVLSQSADESCLTHMVSNDACALAPE